MCLCEGCVFLLHFSISMVLILSQSSGLICDPVAAVLKSATCSHTAASLENFGEVAITVPLPPYLLFLLVSPPPFQTVVAAPKHQISCFFLSNTSALICPYLPFFAHG